MKKIILFLSVLLAVGCSATKDEKKLENERAKLVRLYELEAESKLFPLKLRACQFIDSLEAYKAQQKAAGSPKNIAKIEYFQDKVQKIVEEAEVLKIDYQSNGIDFYSLEELFPKDILEKKGETGIRDKFMFLNAIDFDFSTSKVSYVAHFNIYSPTDRFRKFGFNAGFMKINFSQDSITHYQKDKVLLHPLDELQVGSTYKEMYNRYKIKNSNVAFSAYFQPLYKLNYDYKKTRIFAHAHFELLVSKFTTSIKIDTIQTRDVVILDSLDIPRESEVLKYFQEAISGTKVYINGYFGLGGTWDIYFAKDSNLFLQTTIGYTTNRPQNSSVNNYDRAYRGDNNKVWNSFYLVRANYRQKLSTGAELIIGADIRGLFPVYRPYYAYYTGINLSLEKITDLFK